MRRILGVMLVLVVAAAAVIVGNLRRDTGAWGVDWTLKPRVPAKQVHVELPRRNEIVQTVTGPGKVELIEEASIASQVMAQVQEVRVKKGDRVRKGDLLVKLDDEDAKARLASTEARIDRLKAAIALAQADLLKAAAEADGYRQLESRGFSTPTEVRDGDTTLAKMQAVLEMSEHELKESFAMRRNSEQDLERTEIRAPIDGMVIHLDVEVGEIVIAGTTNLPGTVLMTLGDMDRVRVRADIDEADVALVRRGQPVRVFLQADQHDPIPGTVDLIAPKGTKISEVVSFETLINVEGRHESLRPEMTATVEIEVKRAADALSVPVQAVVHRRLRDLPNTPLFRDWVARQPKTPAEKGKDDAMRYVNVVFLMKDAKAEARPVETGISDQERIEILDGVEPEDTVIVGPFRVLDELEEGQPVELEEPEPTEKTAPSAQESANRPGASR
jgi:HlyD family secretion protein